MAAPGVKFDDGTGGFATNCFPVRTLHNAIDDGNLSLPYFLESKGKDTKSTGLL